MIHVAARLGITVDANRLWALPAVAQIVAHLVRGSHRKFKPIQQPRFLFFWFGTSRIVADETPAGCWGLYWLRSSGLRCCAPTELSGYGFVEKIMTCIVPL